jgi:hypothetical protein
MRLYGAIQKVEPLDDGTVRVYGIATSEAVDEQGEIVRADAMRAAIPEYMRFPALREMHQLSAAGTTLEAEVCDDGTTRIVAHVVDPVAVAKVKNQVYRGFSIGGRVLQREPGNPKTITGLVLNEISLVDRPANPEAVFDCWKAALAADAALERVDCPGPEAKSAIHESGSRAPFNSPIQIWACGVADHRHIAKVDAVKCIEKHASGMTDSETVSNSAKTRKKGIRALLTKVLGDVERIARMLTDLEWMKQALDPDAMIENDDTPQSARVRDLVAELCEFLSALAMEATGDIEGDAETHISLGRKVGARHSSETMQHLQVPHRDVVAAGANCNAPTASESAALSETEQMDDAPSGKGVQPEDLAKALASERAEKEGVGPSLERDHAHARASDATS